MYCSNNYLVHLQDHTDEGVDPGAPPEFLDELTTLYGHTPRDRGTLLSAGDHRERSLTLLTEDTPAAMS